MPFGNCEVPKPGCDGAMTRPPLASSVEHGRGRIDADAGMQEQDRAALTALDGFDGHAIHDHAT